MVAVRRITISICFILLALFILIPSAQALDIRVLLGNGSNIAEATIEQGDYQIQDGTLGLNRASISSGDTITVTRIGSSYLLSVNGEDLGTMTGPVMLVTDDSNAIFRYNGNLYRDSLTFNQEGSSLLIINVVDIEHYLYGVVGEEMGYSAPSEALKAQAIASRSYALSNRQPASKYDVRNTTSDQVYIGYTAETRASADSVIQAVDDTAGTVLWYRNPATGQTSIATTFYSANAGGHTADAVNVWDSVAYPFLGVPSPGDTISSSTYQWTVTYTADEIVSLAKNYAGVDIGQLQDIQMSKLDNAGNPTASGRATKIEIIGSKGTVSATKDNIRSLLGGLRSTLIDSINFDGNANVSTTSGIWAQGSSGDSVNCTTANELKVVGSDGVVRSLNGNASSFYVIGADGQRELSKTESDSSGIEGEIVIEGRGYGHGIGMSQWGAIAMAQNGSGYQEIIEHYYCSDGENTAFYLGDMLGD